jgi:site-specific DNA-methyltransferase (adenine-specific)
MLLYNYVILAIEKLQDWEGSMSPRPITENILFYGDNLFILREHIASESVDLIYLDPPFNSSRNYNVLFKDEHGTESEAQITAFEDTWHWNLAAEAAYSELLTEAPDHVAKMIESLRDFIGTNQMMAYLVMMATRLVELHRVLKPIGCLYLHCDPTASHYLKIILDTIFGPQNFRNEIIWRRTNVHSDAKHWSPVSDTILFYTKGTKFTWNPPYTPHSEQHVESKYSSTDPDGRRFTLSDMTSPNPRPNMVYEWIGYSSPPNGWRYSKETMAKLHAEGRIWYPDSKTKRPRLKRYLDEMPGTLLSSIWTDIPPINSQAAERLGYPTQKPLELLERIIQASSNADSVILDPFCGCGTAIAAAQKLGRKWIGIDITHLSIALQKYRMEAMFPGIKFKVVGEPKDIGAARQLAQEDRYQFQWWALSLIRARPLGGEAGSREGKKGSDKGIDGVIAFIDDNTGKAKRVLVQVKSGHVNSSHIRDLVGTVQREQAAIGVYITLEAPTRDMTTEAVKAGFYHSPGWNKDYPRIQILTIEELLHNAEVKMPPQFGTFKQAQRVEQSDAIQRELGLA